MKLISPALLLLPAYPFLGPYTLNQVIYSSPFIRGLRLLGSVMVFRRVRKPFSVPPPFTTASAPERKPLLRADAPSFIYYFKPGNERESEFDKALR